MKYKNNRFQGEMREEKKDIDALLSEHIKIH